MIRLTEKRMDLFNRAELDYKMSFFDLVFLAMKKLKYDKVDFLDNSPSPAKRRGGVLIPNFTDGAMKQSFFKKFSM